jgi:hypothetical protein
VHPLDDDWLFGWDSRRLLRGRYDGSCGTRGEDERGEEKSLRADSGIEPLR